jgi:crotonobetainyl-CoA:carnitine CoA-transferase CaiB-like acyl-CoA transferase
MTRGGCGPLAKVRVIDITTAIAGPMCTQILADQGADVIKVEQESGDFVRYAGPRKGDLSAIFIAINRNKRSIVLDLKSERGKRALTGLIVGADVLVQNMRPGLMERLGFGWPVLQSLNPQLIYAAISGYGQQGPFANARTFDPMIQATSGVASTQRHPVTGEPMLVHSYVCDKVTSLAAAQAICAALFARSRIGQGQKIELSMLEASLAFMWPEGMLNHTFCDPEPRAPELGETYQLRQATDGFVAMEASLDGCFQALCESLDLSHLKADPRFSSLEARRTNAAALREIMAEELRKHPMSRLMNDVIARGGSLARVNERHELFDDPQIRFDDSLVEYECGKAGRVRAVRPPARFSKTPASPPGAVPELGEHTNEILAELGLI